jgi:RNA polymerase sigma-70 factor (ECF subfamily)
MLTPSEIRGSEELSSEVPPRVSFEELYRLHFDFVWRSLGRLGVHGSQIDDAVQDVFIVMHRRLGDLRPDASPKAFCFGIALRVAQGYRRTARRKGTARTDVSNLADLNHSPFDQVVRAQAVRVLRGFLGGLDSERRAVFLLAELEEMTAPEISQELQVNLSTVYTRLRAARQRFAAYVHAREAFRRPKLPSPASFSLGPDS